MEKVVVEKKMYKGEKLALSSGKSYKIIMEKPRNIEILSATEDGIEDNNTRLFVKSDDGFNKYLYKEEGVDITPATPLPKNKKFTIVIPKSAKEPVFNLFPDTGDMNNLFQFPLKSFIDTGNDDPVKMFVFQPKKTGNIPAIELDGDTSYLNGLEFSPVPDDDGTLLFSQELQNVINIPDGPVEIDSLNNKQCEQITKEILGDDFEEQMDKEKIENEEGQKFWTEKKVISTGAVSSKDVTIHYKILKDFGFKGKFYIKTVKGKQYVIFRGYNGLRKWYTGTRYRVTNPKVINLSAAGKLKSGMKGNAVTILIVGAIDVVDWIMNEEEDKQFEDLCVTLGMDALKTVVTSIITAGLAALALAIIGASAPVWVVISGTILLGVCVGLGIDWIDNKIGTTDYMNERGREAGSFLEDVWNDNIVEPLGRMYYQLEKSIENMYFRKMRFGY